MSENKGGKRKKSYYIKASRGKKPRMEFQLQGGLKGILITCNNNLEKLAVREAYNLFNEYADRLLGPENEVPPAAADSKAENNSGTSSDEDIETSLQQELSSLKSKPVEQRRFQVVSSGAKSCVFIRTTVPHPDQLIHAIFSDAYQQGQSKSRFMLRVLPILGTCRADDDKIQKMTGEILEEFFQTTEARSYMVVSKIRNNDKFSQQKLLPMLQDVILGMNSAHYFDKVEPEIVISVDVIRSVCCLSVLRDYVKFRKYNLQEVVKVAIGDTQSKNDTEDNSAVPRKDTDSAESKVAVSEEKCADGDEKQIDESVVSLESAPATEAGEVLDKENDIQKQSGEAEICGDSTSDVGSKLTGD